MGSKGKQLCDKWASQREQSARSWNGITRLEDRSRDLDQVTYKIIKEETIEILVCEYNRTTTMSTLRWTREIRVYNANSIKAKKIQNFFDFEQIEIPSIPLVPTA
ncbi:hypothetical protein CAPTEDRAFT_196949 [Capitella teleta]|uniref:Uncharacterized protein n=1 Tax=Capitella teleta TaxID=283909 RepID=R7THA4_CAPTE|nr:hypothetical protein CAPTEDRAFT_196949 [Capitella teleta]|eukprot:ELT90961.1 hypothetical protein CAPTEDRAFT_196949 [Capitella teleta]